ncbi:MAG TPA: hypothetical protein VE441_14880 [Mycobacterium sp.]|nr:hypothetical protein [Mycobacterium sp.]
MRTAAKAGVAAVVAFAGSVGAAAGDGISRNEWLIAVAAAVVALGTVYSTPNKPKAE